MIDQTTRRNTTAAGPRCKRQPAIQRGAALALLAVLCLLLGTAPPHAVSARAAPDTVIGVVTDGLLSIGSDAAGLIFVTCVSGFVWINGVEPYGGPAPCASITGIRVTGSYYDDIIDLSSVTTATFSGLTTVTVDGDLGADRIVGTEIADTLNGGAGNDTIEGFKGNDQMNGGPDDDRLIWNNGDNSDTMNGEDGEDTVEVNGAPAGDHFVVEPVGARVAFTRTNLIPFTLDISVEHLQVNGLDGDDVLLAAASPITHYMLDGGPHETEDTLTVDARNNTVEQSPGEIRVSGAQAIQHQNWETVSIINQLLPVFLPVITGP